MTDWKTKWVPAILQYAYQCSGKAAALILQAQKNYEGMNFCLQQNTFTMSNTLHNIYIAGDLAVDEKTALAALCILLPKKGVKDALVHVIQDFKVRIIRMLIPLTSCPLKLTGIYTHFLKAYVYLKF